MTPLYEGKAKRLWATENPDTLRMEFKNDATPISILAVSPGRCRNGADAVQSFAAGVGTLARIPDSARKIS